MYAPVSFDAEDRPRHRARSFLNQHDITIGIGRHGLGARHGEMCRLAGPRAEPRHLADHVRVGDGAALVFAAADSDGALGSHRDKPDLAFADRPLRKFDFDLAAGFRGFDRHRKQAGALRGPVDRGVRCGTGIDVNHVAQIDFDGFKETIDALGGIEIDNPYLVESGAQKFDGRHWRFRKGTQTLNGRNALAYARIRYVSDETVALNEQEGSELGRARRQQRVIDAMVQEIVSKDSVLHPRDVPRAVVQPLLTDISASQMLTFGFGKWWAKDENSLRCRLGGDSDYRDGEDVLIPDEENRAVVRMFLGKQAPVAPDSALSAGCVRQSR